MFQNRTSCSCRSAITVWIVACGIAGAHPGPVRASDKPGASRGDTARDAREVDVRVEMRPEELRVAAGERVELTVAIRATQAVGHVPFHVTFDPGVLRFESGTAGPFLEQDGEDVVFVARPTPDGDRVVVGLSRLKREVGVVGEGVLCTLTFTALAPGDAALDFERGIARSGDRTTWSSRFVPARVLVEGSDRKGSGSR